MSGQPEQWLAALENRPHKNLLRPENLRQQYLSYDLSPLFTPRTKFLGYIGSNYKKLQMTFQSVVRDSTRPDTYLVIGYSKVGSRTNTFEGSIRLTQVREYAVLHYGIDDEYKDAGIRSEGVAVGAFTFKEQPKQPHSGEFDGMVVAFWLIDKDGQLRYDDIEAHYSDSYKNNQYIGRWLPYGSSSPKTANWGERRIPFSGDLDIGAAEFHPNPKYAGQGWVQEAP